MGESVRRYRGQRWLRIAFRTVHIGCAAMVIGAAHFDSPNAAIHGDFVAPLIGSGAVILFDDAYRYGARWLRMAQFWAAFAKVALFAVGLLSPDLFLAFAWSALLIGSVISHASGEVRHFKLWGPRGANAGDNTSSRAANTG